MSVYALGMVVGAPLLTILSARIARKRMLLCLVGLFITAGLVSALAPGFAVLLTGRVLSASSGFSTDGRPALNQGWCGAERRAAQAGGVLAGRRAELAAVLAGEL